MMRQAGRYLPEYRKLREQAGSFLRLCKTPEFACEATLQPLRRFPLDAAIIFSDILVVSEAMGMTLEFKEGSGPFFPEPIRCERDLKKLRTVNATEDLDYLCTAIRSVCTELNGRLPLIGFCGSPWTLAAYMIDGSSKQNFSYAKRMMVEHPDLLDMLLDMLCDSIASSLNAQIESGARVAMIFDSWGGLLAESKFLRFSLAPSQRVMAKLTRSRNGERIPVILFTKGGGAWLDHLANSGSDALGVDWTVDLGRARRMTRQKVALQGNLDPQILLSSPEVVRSEAQAVLASYGTGPGHVFNLGHGITPQAELESVAALVETVHEYRTQYSTAVSEPTELLPVGDA